MMGNENNKRYVVEQTGFECDSIKLLRPAAKSCIDAWIKEVEEYDTRLRNEGYDFPCEENPFAQTVKQEIMGKYNRDYRTDLDNAKKAVETEQFRSAGDIIKFFKKFKGIIYYEYLLGFYIQCAARNINHELNHPDDETDICEISDKEFRDPAKYDFLEKYQSTVSFKEDKVCVMMFYLVEQWIPPKGKKWEFNTTITDANWYIQGLGLRKGIIRSSEFDYMLWYRDINYGREEISGGIGILHGDD